MDARQFRVKTTYVLDSIVMQMRKTNREKGYCDLLALVLAICITRMTAFNRQLIVFVCYDQFAKVITVFCFVLFCFLLGGGGGVVTHSIKQHLFPLPLFSFWISITLRCVKVSVPFRHMHTQRKNTFELVGNVLLIIPKRNNKE